MKTLAVFNNKGGVGKTTLTYHLAYMFESLGLTVTVADLDPQANLTAMFLDEDSLELVWADESAPRSILGAVRGILAGTGDVTAPHLTLITDGIRLIAGDLGLSTFEDKLSDAWPRCLDRKEDAFRVTTAFARAIELSRASHDADLVLLDVGPNLGALNRSALVAADYVVTPLLPDLFSLQGLRNLGPTLREWRDDWAERRQRNPSRTLRLPCGAMTPVGYVVQQHSLLRNRPVEAYARWMRRIPADYWRCVLDTEAEAPASPDVDDWCLARLKHYRSLMPMAMEARKPIFDLRPADGAIGAHQQAVRQCRLDFQHLAMDLARACGVTLPT